MDTIESLNVNLDLDDQAELLDYAVTFRKLATYADTKQEAIAKRIAGNMPEALRLEANCDKVYSTLPAWARW